MQIDIREISEKLGIDIDSLIIASDPQDSDENEPSK